MAGETVITVVGNLVDDPELRFTPVRVRRSRTSGSRPTPATFDRQTNEWKDGDAPVPLLLGLAAGAENVAESLQTGHARRGPGPAQAALLRDPRGLRSAPSSSSTSRRSGPA
jgi:hypothetical protein